MGRALMDYARNHVLTSGSFLTEEHLEELSGIDFGAKTHIATISDPNSLRDGLQKLVG